VPERKVPNMRTLTQSHAVLAAAAMGIAGPALAADMPEEQPYEPPIIERAVPEDLGFIALRGSLNFLNGHDWAFYDAVGGGPTDPPVHTDYRMGWYAGIAGGYYLPIAADPVRLYGELELGYMDNEIDKHAIFDRDYERPWSSGSFKGYIGMASLGAEIETGTIVRPYVSAGIGLAHVKFDRFSVYDINAAGTNVDGWNVRTTQWSNALAYQVSGGALVALKPGMDLELGYRFLGIQNVKMHTRNPTPGGEIKYDNTIDLQNHQVMVGLRQAF